MHIEYSDMQICTIAMIAMIYSVPLFDLSLLGNPKWKGSRPTFIGATLSGPLSWARLSAGRALIA